MENMSISGLVAVTFGLIFSNFIFFFPNKAIETDQKATDVIFVNIELRNLYPRLGTVYCKPTKGSLNQCRKRQFEFLIGKSIWESSSILAIENLNLRILRSDSLSIYSGKQGEIGLAVKDNGLIEDVFCF